MLAEIITKVAAEGQEEWGKFRPRPSAAKKCARALVYHAMDIPPQPFPGRGILVFDDSSWHEELTADWIQKTGYRLHSRQMEVEIVEIPGYGMMKGKIDGIIEDLLGHERLWEHKAINHFTWEKIWSSLLDEVIPEELENYLTQACCYIVGVCNAGGDINEGIISIKNKNTAGYIDVLFKYDREGDFLEVTNAVKHTGETITFDPALVVRYVVQSVVNTFTSVIEHAANKTLPPRPYDINDWHCQYCNYAGVCWEDYEKEFEELEENVELPDDLAILAEQYLELSRSKKSLEKELDEIKKKIQAEMEKRGFRKAAKEDITVTLSLRTRTTLNKERIPFHILKGAEEKKTYKVLDVRRKKAKEGKQK